MKKLNLTLDKFPNLSDQNIKDLYKNLYTVTKKNVVTNKIITRWNSKKHDLRNVLYQNRTECGYCGEIISGSNIRIDHYLPSSKFPYLAYYLYNYVPSCSRCNEANKSDYTPPSIINKKLCDPILGTNYDNIYTPLDLQRLATVTDRLYNPYLDDFFQIISYDFILLQFKSISDSSIGNITINELLSSEEYLKKLNDINIYVNKCINIASDNQELTILIEGIKEISGYSTFIDLCLTHWKEEEEKGCLIKLN